MTADVPYFNPSSLSSVWSGSDIERSLEHANLSIERESGGELHIGPSSMDVHLHPATKHSVAQSEPVNVADPDSYRDWETVGGEETRLMPGEFVLGRTDEVFDLPASVMALLHGRSSVGRLGVFIENAGLIDRGFEGSLTLELYNPTYETVVIPEQTRVGQLVFLKHDCYQGDGYDGKYQGQQQPTTSDLAADGDVG